MFCISAWKLRFFAARFSSLAAPPLSSGFFSPLALAAGAGAPNDDAVAPLNPGGRLRQSQSSRPVRKKCTEMALRKARGSVESIGKAFFPEPWIVRPSKNSASAQRSVGLSEPADAGEGRRSGD